LYLCRIEWHVFSYVFFHLQVFFLDINSTEGSKCQMKKVFPPIRGGSCSRLCVQNIVINKHIPKDKIKKVEKSLQCSSIQLEEKGDSGAFLAKLLSAQKNWLPSMFQTQSSFRILLRGIQLTHVQRYWGSTAKMVFPFKMFTFYETNKWRSRTPDSVRSAHFPSVITTII
jgi:hypothetical protein